MALLVQYLIELSLLDLRILVRHPSSQIAASAVALACCMLDITPRVNKSRIFEMILFYEIEDDAYFYSADSFVPSVSPTRMFRFSLAFLTGECSRLAISSIVHGRTFSSMQSCKQCPTGFSSRPDQR